MKMEEKVFAAPKNNTFVKFMSHEVMGRWVFSLGHGGAAPLQPHY